MPHGIRQGASLESRAMKSYAFLAAAALSATLAATGASAQARGPQAAPVALSCSSDTPRHSASPARDHWGVASEDAAGQARSGERAAALSGDELAEERLGEMYAAGKGVPRDLVKAYVWLGRALVQATGPRELKIEGERDKLVMKMSSAELRRAMRLDQSGAVYHRAANNGTAGRAARPARGMASAS
jgi:hypothetical protein